MRRATLLLAAGLVLGGPVCPQSIQQLLDQGRAAEALPKIETRLQRHPQDAKAVLQRSTALFMLGRQQEGKKALERALRLDPTLRQGWLNRAGLALAEGDYATAWSAFQKAAELDPGAPENELNLGVVRLLQGQTTAASKQFARYLRKHPRSGEAHYLVATNYAMVGLVGPALKTLERAVQLNEKMRLRARTDANFSAFASDPRFQELLSTDSWTAPQGWRTLQRAFDIPYAGGDGVLLSAVLDALQESGTAFDPRVEVTSEWAIIWSRARIQLSSAGNEQGRIQLAAAPSEFGDSEWAAWSQKLLRQIAVQLADRRLKRRPANEPAQESESPSP